MVSRTEDWKYSWHLAYLGQGYSWVKTGEVLWRCGGLSGYLKRMEERLARKERQRFEAEERGRMPSLAGFRAMQDLGRQQVNPWKAMPPEKEVEEAVLEVAAQLGLELPKLVEGGQQGQMREGGGR